MLLPGEARPVFVRLVKRAFSQRRKMMIKLLKQDWETEVLETAYRKLGLSPQVRAESVSLDQFVALTASLLERRGLKRR
jgi:16S rRNA A1518/A1519 N6-dimethyltransferase RsmA/KsgA/DIM1 with predicted DNA glycosylase/AP lyase activity